MLHHTRQAGSRFPSGSSQTIQLIHPLTSSVKCANWLIFQFINNQKLTRLPNGFANMISIDIEMVGFQPPQCTANQTQYENHTFVSINASRHFEHSLLRPYANRA